MTYLPILLCLLSPLPQEAPADAATGTIKGVVSYAGEPVERNRRRPMKHADCIKVCGKDTVPDESLLLDDKGRLRNVIVRIAKGLPKKTAWPVPEKPVVIDQVGCRYTPHVACVMVGQKLVIRNSDPLMHNVHLYAFRNEELNFSQPKKGSSNTIVFEKSEVPVKVTCDVHKWMSAYVGVVKNPYFAITDEHGGFEIKGVPPGEYTLRFWQEELGNHRRKVKVEAGKTVKIEIAMK